MCVWGCAFCTEHSQHNCLAHSKLWLNDYWVDDYAYWIHIFSESTFKMHFMKFFEIPLKYLFKSLEGSYQISCVLNKWEMSFGRVWQVAIWGRPASELSLRRSGRSRCLFPNIQEGCSRRSGLCRLPALLCGYYAYSLNRRRLSAVCTPKGSIEGGGDLRKESQGPVGQWEPSVCC